VVGSPARRLPTTHAQWVYQARRSGGEPVLAEPSPGEAE
jgi:hypothetical protein